MYSVEFMFILSGILAGSGVVLLILTQIGVHLWKWVDDLDCLPPNPLVKGAGNLWGYKWEEGFNRYIKRNKEKRVVDRSEGEGFVLSIAFILACIPILVKVWVLTLFVFSILAVAHLARFARRHKKLFDLHVKDKDAHK